VEAGGHASAASLRADGTLYDDERPADVLTDEAFRHGTRRFWRQRVSEGNGWPDEKPTSPLLSLARTCACRDAEPERGSAR
jgi:hypothetical protein